MNNTIKRRVAGITAIGAAGGVLLGASLGALPSNACRGSRSPR